MRLSTLNLPKKMELEFKILVAEYNLPIEEVVHEAIRLLLIAEMAKKHRRHLAIVKDGLIVAKIKD